MSLSHHRYRQVIGIPRAMVLTVSFALSLVSRAFLPPSPARSSTSLISASGYQDHTTLPYARARARLSRAPRPSHPAPNVRDDREAPPLIEAGQHEGLEV